MGLAGAVVLLGAGTNAESARAGSPHKTASLLAQSRAHLAQADEPQAEPVGEDGGPEAGQPGEAGADVPFSELNEALSAARSRLTELTKAAEIAKVAGELREQLQAAEAENRQLETLLNQLQADFGALQSEKQRADGRLKELETTSEEALAEARRLDEQLVSLRYENGELSSGLAQAEAAARNKDEELAKLREQFSAREDSLTAAADESAGEITRLQREVDAAREQTLAAERQAAEQAAQLIEFQQTVDDASEDRVRLAKDLDGTITELADTRTELLAAEKARDETKAALESAQQERELLREQLTANRSDNEELRGRLQTAEADLERVRSLNSGLEEQVDVLKAAAGEATDAARQNLLAVENRIDEINAALASIKAEDLLPGAGGPASGEGAGQALAGTASDQEAARAGWVPRPSPPRDDRRENGAEAAALDRAADRAAALTTQDLLAGSAGSGRDEQGDATAAPAAAINLASLTTDLPAGQRRDAETLLSELKAEKSQRGLSMTVPGALLFAVNSEEIEPSAHGTLSNVAKLVDLYGQRDILIIGHTDAVGDATYNQRLSERRAALVKAFFVDNFEISAERLQVEGRGEQEPISSNATADGRNANRRVEVVILEP